MELMGILEPGNAPKELMWYAFEPGGTAPSPRVGQTCMYLPAYEDSGKGQIVIVGGANPGCCFSDAHVINLDTYQWYSLNWDGLSPRYEHASFISTGNPGSMWVFGGATQAENQNSVQVINSGSRMWKSPRVEGCIPSPRTFHTTSASIGDKLFVFGGGDKGADPVADKNLYIFDAANLIWTKPDTSGVLPKPRHGHIMVAVGTKLFVHGGMAGKTFYEDLFCIDTDTMKWEELKVKGDVPPACAAHSALSWEKRIYIFGGMTETGAGREDSGHLTQYTRNPTPPKEGEIPKPEEEEEEGEVVEIGEIGTTTGAVDVVEEESHFTSESAQILIGEIIGCNCDLDNLKKIINDVQQKMKNIIDVLGRI